MLTAFLIAVVCQVVDQPVTTDWLLDKNEEALARIHSLRATVESRGSVDGGSSWQLLETIRLVRSGSRERVTRAVRAIINKGRFESLSDDFAVWLNTPEGTWDLGGMDPDHPPSESVSYIEREVAHKGPRITGRISSPRNPGPHGYDGTPAPTALGFVVFNHTLREMRQHSGNVVPVKGHDERGDPTWVLRLKAPEGYAAYEVHLNPKYGYMISAWRCVGLLASNRGLEGNWQVEEFQEPAPGIFIAKKTRQTGQDPEFKTPLILTNTITVADVNRPIPDSDLRLEYPAGVVIGDERDQTFNIWGDGKPALTFKSQSEFRNWRIEQITQALKSRRGWWQEPVTLALIVGAIVLLAALLAYRRRLVSRARAAA
jgi:hypothetical protein